MKQTHITVFSANQHDQAYFTDQALPNINGVVTAQLLKKRRGNILSV